MDICPVGALTSTDFRFKMRVWFLKQTNSIDTESSVGANTTIWSREGVIYRITPRRNDEVNDTWMSDSGRMLYKQVAAADRLTADHNRQRQPPRALDIAINAAADPAQGRLGLSRRFRPRLGRRAVPHSRNSLPRVGASTALVAGHRAG